MSRSGINNVEEMWGGKWLAAVRKWMGEKRKLFLNILVDLLNRLAKFVFM